MSVQSPGEDFGVTQGSVVPHVPAGRSAFTPGFLALSTNPQAGAFTGFQLELTHRDGDQALSGLAMHLPQGVAAMLSVGRTVLGGTGSGGRVPAVERNRARDRDRGAWAGTDRAGRRAGVHHRPLRGCAIRIGDRDASEGGAV